MIHLKKKSSSSCVSFAFFSLFFFFFFPIFALFPVFTDLQKRQKLIYSSDLKPLFLVLIMKTKLLLLLPKFFIKKHTQIDEEREREREILIIFILWTIFSSYYHPLLPQLIYPPLLTHTQKSIV